MKRFENYDELLKEIEIKFSSDIKYAENELNNFLECEGSDNVASKDEKPKCTFKINVDGKEHEIGVTNVKMQEDNYVNYYWVF